MRDAAVTPPGGIALKGALQQHLFKAAHWSVN
jgi:hypothetical protein